MPIRLPLGFEALLVHDGGWRIVLGDVTSSLMIKKVQGTICIIYSVLFSGRQFQERQLSCESCVSFHNFCPEIPKKNAKHEHVCPPHHGPLATFSQVSCASFRSFPTRRQPSLSTQSSVRVANVPCGNMPWSSSRNVTRGTEVILL